MVARQDDRAAEQVAHALLADLLRMDPEGWSAMSGMLAMLALPQIGSRAPMIEVELDGVWQTVHAVRITRGAPGFCPVAVFVHGVNGHSRQWEFPIDAPGQIPAWRPILTGHPLKPAT